MDLSKAFDCIPHDLIAAKLHAYGLSEDAVNFVHSYLKCRKQVVKKVALRVFLKNFYQAYHKVLETKWFSLDLHPHFFELNYMLLRNNFIRNDVINGLK